MINVILIIAAYFPVRYLYDGTNPTAAAAGAVVAVGLVMTKVFLDSDH